MSKLKIKKWLSILTTVFITVLSSQSAMAQSQVTISGVISDSSGETLPGASVVEKGTTNGTITDINGSYTLTLSSDATVEISYVGYTSQDIVVGGKSIISVALTSDNKKLDDVVVVGFGVQKKESVTSAITAIGSEDIARTSSTTVSGSLSGKIAGVNFRQTDGTPGSSTSIQIRNMGTPLYVIDGVQQDEGQFNNLDANDIESISVLKDASASIYGVRAANGVVVVTTKRGKRGQENTVNVTASYGVQEMMKFSDPADVQTYVKSRVQSNTIQGISNDVGYTYQDYLDYQNGTKEGFDWADFIFTPAPQSYLGVNTSGGSENINYYMSVSNTHQDAIIENYGYFDRTNIQFNVNANITDKLSVGATTNGRIESRQRVGVPGYDDYFQAIFASYRNLPTQHAYANDNPEYPNHTTDPSLSFGNLNYDQSGKWREDWRVMQLTFEAKYDFTSWLNLKGVYGYYYAHKQLDNQEYTYQLYTYDEVNDSYDVTFDNQNPFRERDIADVENKMTQLQLNFNKTFNTVHNVSAVLAMESYERSTPSTYVHSIPSANALHLIGFNEMDTYDDYGDETEGRLGYAFRANYDYMGKYLVEFSGRYDGSWKFPPDSRWGFFPSASAGWRVSEENFWKNSGIANTFSNLKVRASYGILGDDNLDGYGAYDYLDGYVYGDGGTTLDGQYYEGTNPTGLAVENLSWIEARIFDVGIDAGFFNNHLMAQVDYFDRRRSGLPTSRDDVQIPSEAGVSLPLENLDEDGVRGMDGSITWMSNVGDFNYSVGGNFTYSRYFDWVRYNDAFGNSWDYYRNGREGRYGYQNWALEAIGQFQSWEEIANYEIDNDRQGNSTLRPGDIKYKDVNNDGVINGMDERPLAYREGSTPNFNYGISFGAQWKNFDLAIDFSGASGYTFAYDYESKNPFHDGGNNPQYYMEDQWSLSDINDPNSELIPGKFPTLLQNNSGHSNYWNSTFWKINARYIKLKNLEFGYTLPSRISEKASIKKARFYFIGQNLFSIDNLPGVDPETTTGSGLQYPTNRILSLGVKLTF